MYQFLFFVITTLVATATYVFTNLGVGTFSPYWACMIAVTLLSITVALNPDRISRGRIAKGTFVYGDVDYEEEFEFIPGFFLAFLLFGIVFTALYHISSIFVDNPAQLAFCLALWISLYLAIEDEFEGDVGEKYWLITELVWRWRNRAPGWMYGGCAVGAISTYYLTYYLIGVFR